jgi:hypothetical protein
MARHEKAQRAAELADMALARAESNFAAAKDAVTRSKNAVVKHKESQVKTEADILAALRQADDLSRDLERLGRRLTDTGGAVARAQKELDAAERRYRDARAYEGVASRIDAQNEKSK